MAFTFLEEGGQKARIMFSAHARESQNIKIKENGLWINALRARMSVWNIDATKRGLSEPEFPVIVMRIP